MTDPLFKPKKKLYTVTASGDTFRVKAELRLEWGFDYYQHEKVWRARGVDEATCSLFRHYARGAEWDGVELTFVEEA